MKLRQKKRWIAADGAKLSGKAMVLWIERLKVRSSLTLTLVERTLMKIKSSVIVVIGVALALTAFSPVSYAQDNPGRDRGGRRGGGGFGGPGGGGGDPVSGLLRSKEVREELKITDAQDAAIQKLAEANRRKRPEGVNFREMSEADRTAFFEKMQKEQAENAAKMKEQLEEVLLPEQIERAQQISLQVQGVRALNQADVAKKLGITAEQKAELKKVQESLQSDMREKMREMFTGGGGGDREGMREKMLELRKEMEAKVLAVLTEDQRSEFEKMKGKPFEMPQDAGFGGRRGGRGGGDAGGPDARGGRRGGGQSRPESAE
jgi:hypothetical protein